MHRQTSDTEPHPRKPSRRRRFLVGKGSPIGRRAEGRRGKKSREAPVALPGPSERARLWTRRRLELFARGAITLAELEGITPDQQKQMADIGRRFYVVGQIEEARQIFRGLMVLDPKNAYYPFMMGVIAQQEKRFDLALHHYDRAVMLNPHGAIALAHRGELRLRLGRAQDAVSDLLRSIRADPTARKPTTKHAQMLLGRLRRGSVAPGPRR